MVSRQDLYDGSLEYILEENTRVDCLTNEYAIEHDFASKWAEAIGQALHYARMTGKRGAVALIMEDLGDLKYLARLVSTIRHHDLPLDVMLIDKDGNIQGWIKE